MQKPNGYDEAKAGGDFIPITLGGHKAKIMQVEEAENRNGGDMIIVSFDFAQEDAQASYMATEYRNDIRPSKKWPISGRWYCNVNSSDGMTNSAFKKFIVNWEKSNGKKVNWNAQNFGAQFKNDKIGAVFGEVEELNDKGQLKVRRKLRWWCEYSAASEAAVPELQAYKAKSSPAAPAVDASGFMTVPDGVGDEELPFN